MLGYGTALAVVLGAFTFTGGKLSGYQRDPTVDEVSRKEYLRKNRRRSIEQTVNELGEGRGKFHSCSLRRNFYANPMPRHICAGVRGEEGREDQGELRNRRQEPCSCCGFAITTIDDGAVYQYVHRIPGIHSEARLPP